MLHLPVAALTVVLGSLIPFLVGIVGKSFSGAVRSVLNGLLSAVAGALTVAIAQHGNVSASTWFLNMALAWGASVVAYHGILAPTGAIDAVVVFVANVLAKVGIHIPVKTVETDLEALITRLEELLVKHAPAAPITNVTNVSNSGTKIPEAS